jgi:hypothetical protein
VETRENKTQKNKVMKVKGRLLGDGKVNRREDKKD